MVTAEVLAGSGAILLIGLTRHETERLVAGRAMTVHVLAKGPTTLILTAALTNEAVEAQMRAAIDDQATWARIPEPPLG